MLKCSKRPGRQHSSPRPWFRSLGEAALLLLLRVSPAPPSAMMLKSFTRKWLHEQQFD